MLDEQKKLIQEQHRLEQAQMRNRSKEQKARTRRLIQEGSILEKVFPWVKNVADLEELENRLCAISKKTEYRTKASRESILLIRKFAFRCEFDSQKTNNNPR